MSKTLQEHKTCCILFTSFSLPKRTLKLLAQLKHMAVNSLMLRLAMRESPIPLIQYDAAYFSLNIC